MTLHFQHLRDTLNIGDRSCSPYDYFDWPDATVSDIRAEDTPNYDVGIYGGGKIFGGLTTYKGVTRRPGAVNIAWGVGTSQAFPISPRYTLAKRRMDLVGSRDFGDDRYEYAPCPSCISPLFDAPAPPEHEVVFYKHAGKTDGMKISIPDSIPTLDNRCDTLARSLAFIASGATVVSNSYHGVYWGLLMGRKVICLPFSKKFNGYRLKPHYATPQNWQQEIPNGRAQPEMLALTRKATHRFKAIVDEYHDKALQGRA